VFFSTENPQLRDNFVQDFEKRVLLPAVYVQTVDAGFFFQVLQDIQGCCSFPCPESAVKPQVDRLAFLAASL